jgi:endo-beta-N-acetylglucosaminidase D
MHDYRGNYVQKDKPAGQDPSTINYLDDAYEACQGAPVTTKDYFVEYWQHIEIFNYFSHRRATIPPVTWINAGHRNGALVLGTFIIEFADWNKRINHPESNRVLEKSDATTYKLASALAHMAQYYGFDGWLLNIETGINMNNGETWNYQNLETLIKQLRAKIPHGKVIW